MKPALKSFIVCLTAIAVLALGSCGIHDRNRIIDQNTEVENQNWGYHSRISCVFDIADAAIAYNLYLNLRVTPDYKYSNIFILIHQVGPDKKTETTRYEFTLADKDGQWLGRGTGNLYTYQVPFRTSYKFPVKGKYRIEIEQNMRDNPLHQVSDVGLRVEKAE
ncbi:gliding motility-associated lipoprotein GldH [Mucilaginibacter gracilis]|uniref:Gliding motility-associated lipoprotein GldH n=1 Tax=Mucilaginibacter gracilis TaxID=423350 RepID=A0A495IYK1_9SPHI|nr:gliding motility lipoprotein GldH [Mucilaginibacter gracilis]RKR81134.1 gliding motility-associated lipoprotein GldH [Mucilaginibacter gracilis]